MTKNVAYNDSNGFGIYGAIYNTFTNDSASLNTNGFVLGSNAEYNNFTFNTAKDDSYSGSPLRLLTTTT